MRAAKTGASPAGWEQNWASFTLLPHGELWPRRRSGRGSCSPSRAVLSAVLCEWLSRLRRLSPNGRALPPQQVL